MRKAGPNEAGRRSGLEPAFDAGSGSILRALLATGSAESAKRLAHMLAGSATCERASSIKDAIVEHDLDEFELLIVDGRGAGCLDRAGEVAALWPGTAVVVLMRSPAIEQSLAALRSGVVDVIDTQLGTEELSRRLAGTVEAGRSRRRRERAMDRLWALCAQDPSSTSGDLSALATGLERAFESSLASGARARALIEFRTLLRQELDVEGVLRTALQQMMVLAGPINAAVFLPSSDGDFSLGAYVNLDLSPQHADLVLDQLANAISPQVEGRVGLIELVGEQQIARAFGTGGSWLGDRRMTLYACRAERECLAVLALMPRRGSQLCEDMRALVSDLGDALGEQLGRVVRVHHRHLPKDKWGTLTEPRARGDDLDLAA